MNTVIIGEKTWYVDDATLLAIHMLLLQADPQYAEIDMHSPEGLQLLVRMYDG